ncbi:Fic family protein [Opitutales bacterium]|nr:Fic family protein [Opitutales bacterium]
MKVKFLSTDEVLAMQERLIDCFGGTHGVRDPGILESALYRPQSGYYQDLAEMASALFESLLMNRPFLDGNKRVAFFAPMCFFESMGIIWKWTMRKHIYFSWTVLKVVLVIMSTCFHG